MNRLYKDKKWLHQKYILDEYSAPEIAKICKAEKKVIYKWLHKFSIPVRNAHECSNTKRFLSSISGPNHWFWKGGKIMTPAGYILILKRNHPYATKSGYVLEHRLITEKRIGRYLHPWEVVHHINGIKDDNRDENLELLSNKGKHNNLTYKLQEENISLKKTILMLMMLLERKHIGGIKWAENQKSQQLHRHQLKLQDKVSF